MERRNDDHEEIDYTKLPPWLEEIKKAIPNAVLQIARGNDVDKVLKILAEISIPNEDDLILKK